MNWIDYKLIPHPPNLSSPIYKDEKKLTWFKVVQSILLNQMEFEIPPIEIAKIDLVHHIAHKLCRKFALRVNALAIERGMVKRLRTISEADNYKAHPLNKLANAARKIGLSTDCALQHNGTTHPCHRAVIEAKASYFDPKIASDIPQKSVEILLDYLYEDPYKLPEPIEKDVLKGLARLARLFDLPFLFKIVRQRENQERDAFGCHFSFDEELFSALKEQLRNQEAFSWRYKPVIHSTYGKLYVNILEQLQIACREGNVHLHFVVPSLKINLTESLRIFYIKAFKVKIGVDLSISPTDHQTMAIEATIEKDNPVLFPLIERLNRQRLRGIPYHKFLLDLKTIGRHTPLDLSTDSSLLLHFLYEQPLSNVLHLPLQQAATRLSEQNALPFLKLLLSHQTRSEVMKICDISTLRNLQFSMEEMEPTPLQALVRDRLLELEQNALNEDELDHFSFLGSDCTLQFGENTLDVDEVILSSLSLNLQERLKQSKALVLFSELSSAEVKALSHYFRYNGRLPKSLSEEQLKSLHTFSQECDLPSLALEIEKRANQYLDPYLNAMVTSLFLLAKKQARSGAKHLDTLFHIDAGSAMEDTAIFSLLQPLLKYRYGILLKSFTFLRPSTCSGKLYCVQASWHPDNLKVYTLRMRFHSTQIGSLIKIYCHPETLFCHTTLLQNSCSNIPLPPSTSHTWHSHAPPHIMRHFLNSLYTDEKLPDDHLNDDDRQELACLKDMLGVD
ncbi:MAG: hypothetical protein ACK5MA_06810 [Parachlamydiaceae bacterium]